MKKSVFFRKLLLICNFKIQQSNMCIWFLTVQDLGMPFFLDAQEGHTNNESPPVQRQLRRFSHMKPVLSRAPFAGFCCNKGWTRGSLSCVHTQTSFPLQWWVCRKATLWEKQRDRTVAGLTWPALTGTEPCLWPPCPCVYPLVGRNCSAELVGSRECSRPFIFYHSSTFYLRGRNLIGQELNFSVSIYDLFNFILLGFKGVI